MGWLRLLLPLLLTDALGADLYAALGVSRDVDDRTLKKAYRRVALQNHPDKQKDKSDEEKKSATDAFIAASNAFEVLSDPEKRTIYDRYGEAGLKGSEQARASGFGGGAGFAYRDPMHIFEAMFGQGAFGGGGAQIFMDSKSQI